MVIDFNCLGTEIKTKMLLTVEVPLYSPIKLFIDKECSKEDFVDMLTGNIVSQGAEFGIFNILLLFTFCFLVLYLTITCYNLCNGKELSKSVPCGGILLSYFNGPNLHIQAVKQGNGSEMIV